MSRLGLIVSSCVVGCTTVEVDGPGAFGVPLGSYWTGADAGAVYYVGNGGAFEDPDGFVHEAAIVLSTAGGACERQQRWYDGWIAASERFVERAGGDPDRMCAEAGEFLREMTELYAEHRSAARHELRIEACVTDDCSLAEGRYETGPAVGYKVYPVLQYIPAIELDPDGAIDAWDPVGCRLVDERYDVVDTLITDVEGEAWLVLDGSLAVELPEEDGPVSGDLSGDLYERHAWYAGLDPEREGSLTTEYVAEPCELLDASRLVSVY